MEGKRILRSNFLIVYQDLVNAVEEYRTVGHIQGTTERIDAYLAATIHALIDFCDRTGFWENSEVLLACKYANNTLKHNEKLVTHKKVVGGVSFPIEFPLEIEPIVVVWNYSNLVQARYKEQNRAFKELFAGREIIETLRPIAEKIANEV